MKLSQRRMARPSLGGLLATRQGALLVALLCAVCAAVLIFFSLSRYKAGLRTTPPQATVLVASGTIPQGTAGATIASEKLYTATPVAASQVTPGAISDASVLAGETANTTILPGQQLTTTDFSGLTSVSETLAPNQRAVSITIAEAPGDTDVVQAGDHVDIYDNIPTPNLGTNASPGSAAVGTNTALVLPIITDALVLKSATGTPVKHEGVPITGSSMVLAVNADQVQLLISAEMHDQLYLSLRPQKSDQTPGTQLASKATLLSTNVLNTLSQHFPTTLKGLQ